MDKEKELLEQYEVSLYTFEPDRWAGRGFYDSETRTIFLNSSLSSDERHRVLLHELGHLEHIGSIYRHSAMSCENQANRFMKNSHNMKYQNSTGSSLPKDTKSQQLGAKI